jgi:prophage regulatory protein
MEAGMRILRRKQVQEQTGLSRTVIYERVAHGDFPKPIKLGVGARAVGWLESEINGWIEAQVAASRKGAA